MGGFWANFHLTLFCWVVLRKMTRRIRFFLYLFLLARLSKFCSHFQNILYRIYKALVPKYAYTSSSSICHGPQWNGLHQNYQQLCVERENTYTLPSGTGTKVYLKQMKMAKSLFPHQRIAHNLCYTLAYDQIHPLRLTIVFVLRFCVKFHVKISHFCIVSFVLSAVEPNPNE